MRRAIAAAAGLLVLLLVSACGPHSVPSAVGPSDVAVDTPALEAQKKAAGIQTCKPGDASTASLPDLTLPCLGGGPSVNLRDLEGPLVINLWSSACGPCRKEMPALQQFYEQYGDRVGMLGIDMETYPGAAIDFARQAGAKYPQLVDPGGAIYDQRTLPISQGLPQFVFVSADGQIERTAGGMDSVAVIKQTVEEKLGVTL